MRLLERVVRRRAIEGDPVVEIHRRFPNSVDFFESILIENPTHLAGMAIVCKRVHDEFRRAIEQALTFGEGVAAEASLFHDGGDRIWVGPDSGELGLDGRRNVLAHFPSGLSDPVVSFV